MAAVAVRRRSIPPLVAGGPLECGDLRFRQLVGDAQWARLSAAVRRRFGCRLPAYATALYVGRIHYTRMSRAGRVICRLAALIGAPLPHSPGSAAAASVAVTECPELGGQIWTRIYSRPGRLPQVIHSAKRFAGPTGLEESVPGGVGMQLEVHVETGALIFRSHGYFCECYKRRIAVPKWLHPGVLTVIHRELGRHRFTFTLTIDHPWFGRILEQQIEFRDAAPMPDLESPRRRRSS